MDPPADDPGKAATTTTTTSTRRPRRSSRPHGHDALSSTPPSSSSSALPPPSSQAPPPLLRCTSTPLPHYDLRSLSNLGGHGHFLHGLVTPPPSSSAETSSSSIGGSVESKPTVVGLRHAKSHQNVSCLATKLAEAEAEEHYHTEDEDSGVHTLEDLSHTTSMASGSLRGLSSSLASISSLSEAADATVFLTPSPLPPRSTRSRNNSSNQTGARPKVLPKPSTSQSSSSSTSSSTSSPLRRSTRLRRRDICGVNSDDSGYDASGHDSSASTSSCRRLATRFIYPPGHFLAQEHVDVLRQSADMNLSHVVKSVLRCLDASDLCRVAMVSTTWRDAVDADQDAEARRKEFMLTWKLNLENSVTEPRFPFSSPRKAMNDVSNLLTRSPTYAKREREKSNRPAVISPSKIRHRLFVDEAAKLSPGETLSSCPRCTSPARVTPATATADCLRRSCGFRFCTVCMCKAAASLAGGGGSSSQSDCARAESGGQSDSACAGACGGGAAAAPSNTAKRGSRETIASKKSKSRLKRL